MRYAEWSRLWDLITNPSAVVAVYLAPLCMYFKPSFIDETKDAVLLQLQERGLSVKESNVAQKALDVFIKLIKREESAKTDIEKFRELLRSIKRSRYERFKCVELRTSSCLCCALGVKPLFNEACRLGGTC